MYFTYTRGVGLDRKEGASFRSDTESVEGGSCWSGPESARQDLEVEPKVCVCVGGWGQSFEVHQKVGARFLNGQASSISVIFRMTAFTVDHTPIVLEIHKVTVNNQRGLPETRRRTPHQHMDYRR